MQSQEQSQEADHSIEEASPAQEREIDSLTAEFDALLERMQTPEARAGADRLFSASPEELAQAAADAALKRVEP